MSDACGEAAAVVLLLIGFGAVGGGLSTSTRRRTPIYAILGTIVGVVFIVWSIYAYLCSP